ncbi:Armadillo-like helical [Cynara cardunculus var. scolymus]|uniref:Armadillo-like helical n=1 Tax=Cynara cardunculus var. scolymus TaxID=59895 RepID=A0A103YDV9_CYNCS|nr:Armadillo-like helical [Cynara cardunculus var. scolymus]
MSTESASQLVDLIFMTLYIYDDRGSRKAVDDLIVKELSEVIFMKTFAATLVQGMEKQLKFQSHVGCYRLMNWSCLLLCRSQFISVSKSAFSRVAASQASILQISMQGSSHERRACRRTFIHSFFESPDIFSLYMEELKGAKISYKNCPEMLCVMLDFSSSKPSLFERWKPVYLDMYVQAVLNTRDKPTKALSEAFRSLFFCLSHEDFKSVILPSSVKMLKRNPELVLESIGVLLRYVNLDLSKYGVEILSVVLAQARHADEGRRLAALDIVRCLCQKSSNPDAVEAMFSAVKSVIGGSEGRLAFPYQRVGMINALQELSRCPEGKYLGSLSLSVCDLLLTSYKDDGNEEVKHACLTALASWVARSTDAIRPEFVSFMALGLKEKESLRRGHLRCLRIICKNPDAVLLISSLLPSLVQLVKTGFTKAAQRLDGIYALLIVVKIAAADIKADETVSREKLWSLISQNEPSVVPVAMTSKLSLEDCETCIELLESLFVDHPQRVFETLHVRSLMQLILTFLCHSSWDIRKAAYGCTKKILSAAPKLFETLLIEYSDHLNVVGEKVLAKLSDTETSSDAQIAFVPSVEVLVKALMVISSGILAAAPSSCIRLIFISHHPCLVGTAKNDAVWKRLQKCLRALGFDVIGHIMADVSNLCQSLLGPMGLMSTSRMEQEAAIHTLSTLMTITPAEAYAEFEKVNSTSLFRKIFNNYLNEHLKSSPDRGAHDMLSENDIQIFHTPEGMVSTEQGVYIAESVASNNMKQAKGRFRTYENSDSMDNGNSTSGKRETAGKERAGAGKKDIGKQTRKPGKCFFIISFFHKFNRIIADPKSRDVLAGAWGSKKACCLFWYNAIVVSDVKFVNPLLQSRIVNEVAFETVVKLSRCTAPPLSNWGLDIATALRLITTTEPYVSWDRLSSLGEGDHNDRSSLSLFERVMHGLSVSCKSGPLPVDSFRFIFPVLYHVLGAIPAYQGSVVPALNELCLGLQPEEATPALSGVYAKDVHVRMACLNAVKCIPAVSSRSLPQDVNFATSIWIALHDPEKVLSNSYNASASYLLLITKEFACTSDMVFYPLYQFSEYDAILHAILTKDTDIIALPLESRISVYDIHSVAEVAEDIWDRYDHEFGTDYSGLFRSLSHVNYNVRMAAADALAAALDEYPDTIQEALATLFSLYIRDGGISEDNIDSGWLGRQGTALALHAAADVLRTKDLPVVMTFLISRALADTNADVRGRMINAGIMIIDKHGKDNVSLLFPIFENYLNKKASDEEKYDLVREGVVIFTGALAKHLSKDDPKVHAVVEKLLEVLNTPSEAVQRAVSSCLSPLMKSKQEDGMSLVSRLLDQLMKSEKYGERRGAAFGLAGVIKGFGISSLKKYGVATVLREGLANRNSAKCREGALLAFECLCEKLGKLFEPYVIYLLPLLLVSFSDQVVAVREAAESHTQPPPNFHLFVFFQLKQLQNQTEENGLEDKAWRTKQSSVQLLGAMAYCAPQQLSQCLPKIVPKLTEVLTDTHPKVQSAGQTALQQVGSVIKNPEIASLVPTLLLGLTDPNDHTKYSLDILLQTTFINSIDAPSLALLVPIVHRGLRERGAETKKKAAQIAGNMCSLVTDPTDMLPYIGLLLPEIKKVLVDPIPEVRSVAARAVGSLIRGMGEENFPDLVPWLLDTLKSDGSNVERSGAAQGLSEVVAALGTEYFEHLLPDIIRNCSHQKASVRDGYLTLFKYLPRSLGVQFQNYLQQVLPSILDGLADENESVREAALGAGHILVEHYAVTSLPLLLPAVEDGIFNDNWRIRQSSVELLGDLLFKVAGTSGKALLEGGSDDEGASTEAQGRAIIEVLGRDKRNEVLAALYMVRTDVSLSVRQAALHVWKTIVVNTPKTLKEIMPVLMNTLISSLASSSSERRQVAGRALGELVRKLGERVLPLVIPILSQGLKDPDSSRRQGVCIGLSEVMASAEIYIFYSMVEVRESAGVAFSTLYKSAGMQAIDEIVPTLLHALEDDDMADTALDGLKQILSVRTAAVLPHILPKLVHLPLSEFNAHALGAVAEVACAGLNEVQDLAKKAAETVVLVIDDEGIENLISELLKGVGDNQASTRRSSAYLIGYFFKNSKLYLVDEAPNMISILIILLSDSDSATVSAAWEALSRVVSSVPKEVLPSYIKLVRDAVSTSRDKERRKKKGGPIVIPGFCLPKALQPLLPIYLQGLISGSAELREQAAQGLGELIEVTSEKALKEFVIPITGPLIRIIGDRFPWQVKSAILSTLTIIIAKGGMALKPFLPQLQTTFVKCLQDNTRTVRSSAASALGKLSALSTRVDPLVGDLLSNLQASEGGVREAILVALQGVVKYAGKSVSAPVKTRVFDLLKVMIYNDDDQIRSSSARILGILSEHLEDDQISELLEELPDKASSPNWSARHGSLLTISSMLRHIPTIVAASPSFTTDPSNTNAHKGTVASIASAMQDDSSEVRRRALFALKAVAKANPTLVMIHVTVYGPVLAECLKDGSMPVRLAAERCSLHALQLTKGIENVQAAQKYLTGLDARRIAKLSEYSDDSDDSEDDSASG